MKKARHRALTLSQHVQGQGSLDTVEMKKARHRALTPEVERSYDFFRRRPVEMKKARHRALTPDTGSQETRIPCHGRNEKSPS